MTGSTAYREYAALLGRLHELDRRGAADSAEADELRERMDPLWSELSDEEQRLAVELSKHEEGR